MTLNFRTAYYKKDGTREVRGAPIARRYLAGWFAVDAVSMLPLSYIPYLSCGCTDPGAIVSGRGVQFRRFR